MAARTAGRRTRRAASEVKVVGGYTRLSVNRNGKKIGHEVQRDAIEKWAAAYGYEVRWYPDDDVTAASRDVVRPQYERMLEDLQNGEIGGIAVWKLDRLCRLAREFERCVDIVRSTGGFIADCEAGQTTKDGSGEIMMRVLTLVAQMEVDAMRARQLAHQRKKAEQGRPSGGGYRAFGFVGAERDESGRITNGGKIGVLHVPREAKLLRDAAKEIASQGKSYADVVSEWAQRDPPVLGTNGKPMSVGSLVDILTSPRVAGLRVVEDVDEDTGEVTRSTYKAVWKPIIDRETWEKLRQLRKLRPEGNRPSAPYLLTGGLAVCGRCGKRMIGGPRKKYKVGLVPGYRCDATVKAKQNGSCGGITVEAADAENVVVEALFARLEDTPELLEYIKSAGGEAPEELTDALNEVRRCDEALATVATQRHLPEDHEDHLEEVEWRAIRGQLRERKTAASRTITRLQNVISVPLPQGDDWDDLPGWFSRLAHSQRVAVLRAALREVVILPATPGTRSFDPLRVKPFFTDSKKGA